MVMNVRERVSVRGLRQQDGSTVDLVGRRFMGTLFHPVPRVEMMRRCGVNQNGCKIVVDWPAHAQREHPVQVGDRVEVDGRQYPIHCVEERPGCYLDLYIERP